MKSELEQLCEEVAALRKEVADLRADRAVHHYHHQAQPAPYGPPSQPWPYQPPLHPGYYPSVSGKAISVLGGFSVNGEGWGGGTVGDGSAC